LTFLISGSIGELKDTVISCEHAGRRVRKVLSRTEDDKNLFAAIDCVLQEVGVDISLTTMLSDALG